MCWLSSVVINTVCVIFRVRTAGSERTASAYMCIISNCVLQVCITYELQFNKVKKTQTVTKTEVLKIPILEWSLEAQTITKAVWEVETASFDSDLATDWIQAQPGQLLRPCLKCKMKAEYAGQLWSVRCWAQPLALHSFDIKIFSHWGYDCHWKHE